MANEAPPATLIGCPFSSHIFPGPASGNLPEVASAFSLFNEPLAK
jgi:hypothetical protein